MLAQRRSRRSRYVNCGADKTREIRRPPGAHGANVRVLGAAKPGDLHSTARLTAAILGSMKAISAAIIVLAGAAIFIAGTFNSHSDTQVFVCGVGLVLCLAGLVGWVVTLTRRD